MEKHKNYSDIESNQIETFGITASLVNGKLFVDYIYDNSSASEAGITLGDQIISINDKDYTDVKLSEYCDIIFNGLFPEELNEVELVYKNQGIQKKVILKKKVNLGE
ncbi:PDZ domain-containing protein [Bacteroidota bacterium]